MKKKYVTLEQAKLLKEKGFDVRLEDSWVEQYPHIIESNYTKFNDIEFEGFEPKILNTKSYLHDNNYKIHAPAYEQHEVIDWLLEKHDIWVNVNWYIENNIIKWNYIIDKIGNFKQLDYLKNFNSPQEAYSSAFDYILKNLI